MPIVFFFNHNYTCGIRTITSRSWLLPAPLRSQAKNKISWVFYAVILGQLVVAWVWYIHELSIKNAFYMRTLSTHTFLAKVTKLKSSAILFTKQVVLDQEFQMRYYASLQLIVLQKFQRSNLVKVEGRKITSYQLEFLVHENC